MTENMNATLTTGKTASPSKGLAIIKLIPKVNKPERVADYRPISLLCTDYKLLAAVLNGRLRKPLPDVIGDLQRGGIPGRRIDKTLCLFRDTIQYMEERGRTGGLIAVDLSRAYDLVKREVIWKVMKKNGLPIYLYRMASRNVPHHRHQGLFRKRNDKQNQRNHLSSARMPTVDVPFQYLYRTPHYSAGAST